MRGLASVLGTIFIFGLVVLVHEFGHFIMARRFGVKVIEFAIGMGPKLIGKQKGDTLFSIRAIPFGGFCMMLGEGEESETGEIVAPDDPRSLTSKSIPQRMGIFAGGVVMNVILALFLFSISVTFGAFNGTHISVVLENSPAEIAGLQTGDRLIEANGSKLHIAQDLDLFSMLNTDKEVDIVYERAGSTHETIVSLEADENGQFRFGFMRERVYGILSNNPGLGRSDENDWREATVAETIKTAWFTMVYSVRSVFVGIKSLVVGKLGLDGLAGPIGMGKMIGDVVVDSLEHSVGAMILSVLEIAGLLSANLAVMNLLPLPGLDGGHILFLLVEGVRGKPLEARKQGIINLVGLALVMLLAVVVAFSDITKLFNP